MSKTGLLGNIVFALSLIFAIWFLLTAYVWVYLAALIISYPFGLLSLLMWFYLKKDGKKRNNAIIIVLGLGLTLSLVALLLIR